MHLRMLGPSTSDALTLDDVLWVAPSRVAALDTDAEDWEESEGFEEEAAGELADCTEVVVAKLLAICWRVVKQSCSCSCRPRSDAIFEKAARFTEY